MAGNLGIDAPAWRLFRQPPKQKILRQRLIEIVRDVLEELVDAALA